MRHCWHTTGLLDAWDITVQREAISKFHELFDKKASRRVFANVDVVDDVPQGEPEDDAAHEGAGFMDVGEREMHPDAECELVKDFIIYDFGADAEE